MPASQQQIRDQSRKVPDSKRTTAAGRPAKNRYDEVVKQMSRPGAFVMDLEWSSPQQSTASSSQSMGIRLFLADPRGLKIMKS